MLTVRREQKGDVLVLHFSGDIDESVDFEAAVGSTAPMTVLNCKEVPRINSLGVKGWIRFFQERVAQGTRLRFVECSPAIVEQINLIMNFACGGTVESIYIPYVCATCRKGFVCLFTTEQLKQARFNLPELDCTKCGSKAIFDDFPEEYFRFASR